MLICKTHPRYKAIRKPQLPCINCWEKFLETSNFPLNKIAKAIVNSIKKAEKLKHQHPNLFYEI